MLKLAWPVELKPTVSTIVAPTLKVTVPLGTPAPEATALTWTVKFTGWP